MVKDLETKLSHHTINYEHRFIFEIFYDLSESVLYNILSGPSGIIITGMSLHITFSSNMNIANVEKGELGLQNKTLNLNLFGKRNFTLCVVMRHVMLCLNRNMYIKTFMGNEADEEPHLIYDKTTKKLTLQTNGLRAGSTNETSITLLCFG